MKTYRVVLTSFGTVFVQAEEAFVEQGTLCFLQHGNVCARYGLSMVKSYEEAVPRPSFIDRNPPSSPPP